ncbi:MAG: hypothetical protein PW789_10720 [Edaphobacter sp.]|uniref:hypothetical protein n=1 Tax=Edaphobacter sp. TaxID=1934404 RepID=UPI0023A1DA2A|nr:hypothetical protein [Edaphobacter sp.]MDE1177062.1 hypothetical protein [Edaphobacter sp.]
MFVLASGFWACVFPGSALLAAQSYEHTPLYQKVASPATDAVMIRHASANGVTMDISVASDEAGWSEGLRTDGSPQHQTLHLYIEATESDATFAYDLDVEPVEGTRKIRCTFKRQNADQFSEFKHASQTVPLNGDLAPVLVDDGSTLAISMFADRDKKQKIVQYLHIRLSSAKETAWTTVPVMGQSCVRVR